MNKSVTEIALEILFNIEGCVDVSVELMKNCVTRKDVNDKKERFFRVIEQKAKSVVAVNDIPTISRNLAVRVSTL